MKPKNQNIIVAKPYHDLDNPFSIDENGAIAEYIINDPEEMPQIAIGATIVIRDQRREGNIYSDFWYAGRIIGLKSVSPFNPERTTMLYSEDIRMDPTTPLDTGQLKGPHTHQPMLIQVFLTKELSKTDEET